MIINNIQCISLSIAFVNVISPFTMTLTHHTLMYLLMGSNLECNHVIIPLHSSSHLLSFIFHLFDSRPLPFSFLAFFFFLAFTFSFSFPFAIAFDFCLSFGPAVLFPSLSLSLSLFLLRFITLTLTLAFADSSPFTCFSRLANLPTSLGTISLLTFSTFDTTDSTTAIDQIQLILFDILPGTFRMFASTSDTRRQILHAFNS